MSYNKVFLKPYCEPSQPASLPLFQPQQIQGGRADGYWLEAFPFRTSTKKCPNLIGYGLGTKDNKSDIQMFINPYADKHDRSAVWASVSIATLEFPVAMHYADITGNGYNDVIICDMYGPGMDDIWANGGRVNWLENTGDPKRANWTRRTIGKSPGMHRLRAGHFTRKDRLQICAVPIVVASSDLTTPAPVIIFTAPDDPKTTEEDWPSEVATKAILVHEAVIVSSADTGKEYDEILLAGRNGVDLVWYDGSEWRTFNVGKGLPRTLGDPYWGAGSAAVGRINKDYAGYIASSEEFHGNVVSVYLKPAGSKPGIVGNHWIRHVLDDYGSLNTKHTGSIHQVICADIDGDGCDEFLVAMMGSDPPDFDRTGVWCYKLTDKKGTFTKTKLSSISAGRITTGHFMSDAPIDFATISYSVPGYFESPNPSINIFFSTGILAERLEDEVYFRAVRAGSTKFVTEMEFLDVSGYKMSLVVLPPSKLFRLPVSGKCAVKVMAGMLSWTDSDIRKQERVMATRPFVAQAMKANADFLESGDEGVIFMMFKPSQTSGKPPYTSMHQLLAHNILPPFVPDDVRAMRFPWVKVENRPWAHGRFKGLEFYNLVGWHVRFADDSMDEIAHVQMWTAGKGVSAGFHNHVEKSFCEIHACLVNGTGKGGMRWATVPDSAFDPNDPDLSKTELVVVPDLHEHGALWRTQHDGYPLIRMNDTIDYPWHAWLAGDGQPGTGQAFDVWVAYEFPSFESYSTPTPQYTIRPDRYIVTEPYTEYSIGLKNQDSTDGTPVQAYPPPLIDSQRWNVSRVPGTDLYEFAHDVTGSLLCAQWPPIDGQRLVGTHSPANMGLTSRWAVSIDKAGKISLRLPGANRLFLSVAQSQSAIEDAYPVVLKQDSGVAPPTWSLRSL